MKNKLYLMAMGVVFAMAPSVYGVHGNASDDVMKDFLSKQPSKEVTEQVTFGHKCKDFDKGQIVVTPRKDMYGRVTSSSGREDIFVEHLGGDFIGAEELGTFEYACRHIGHIPGGPTLK